MIAWTLARKDLAIYARDRTGLLLGIGLPLVLATVFGLAMGGLGGGGGAARAELVVEDRDQSEASSELVRELQSAEGLRTLLLEEAGADARGRVASGDAPAALVIGAGYAAALEDGSQPPLTLYRDPGKLIEQQIIAGNLIPAFFSAAGEELGRRSLGRLLEAVEFPEAGRAPARAILEDSWERMEALVDQLEEEEGVAAPAGDVLPRTEEGAAEDQDGGFSFADAAGEILGLEVEDVVGGSDAKEAQKLAQQSHAVAGIAVMMLLFGLVACGATLLAEEAEGTLERLRLAPGTGRSILAGKFLFTFVIGLAQLVILFVYGRLLFDIPIFRAPLALLVHSVAVAGAVTGFGVLFAVLCRTQKQLEGLSTIAILTMSALGGSWWPLAITPEWYQKLAHFTLNAWAMDGYQGIFWYGKGLAGILPSIGILLGIALATSWLASRLWARRWAV